jgi:hypothetical protein
MGINVEWLAPNTNIINLTVEGNWTWNDFYTARAQMHDMMEASPYAKVDYILDLHSGHLLPQNILSHMRNMDKKRHHKSRHMVVIGANHFITTMFGLMNRTLPDRMHNISFGHTREDALKLLRDKYALPA